MQCERTPDIHAYHDGQVDARRAAEIEAHLERCGSCAALLADLRRLSALVTRAALPEMTRPVADFYAAWNRSRDRALLRITSWLTGVAACLLVGALLAYPRNTTMATARPGPWESAAVMPADQTAAGEPGSDLVQVAQWMATDLSYPERR